jgi:hypothetical protein
MERMQSTLKGDVVVDLAPPSSKGVLAQSGVPPCHWWKGGASDLRREREERC